MKTFFCKLSALVIPMSVVFFGSMHAQTISDKDVLKNIASINDPVSFIERLEPVQFEYKTDEYKYLKLPAGTHYGLIAQDVQPVYPFIVTTRRQSYMAGKNLYKTTTVKSVDYEALVPVLLAAIKQQQQEIEQLRKDLDKLNTK
jgi:hypothetical protein